MLRDYGVRLGRFKRLRATPFSASRSSCSALAPWPCMLCPHPLNGTGETRVDRVPRVVLPTVYMALCANDTWLGQVRTIPILTKPVRVCGLCWRRQPIQGWTKCHG